MKRTGLVALSAFVLLLSACTTTPLPPAAASTAEVTRFLETWNAALAARNKAAVRAAYSNSADFRWFEDGVLRYKSADEVASALDQFPPGTQLSTVLSDIVVQPLDGTHVQVSAGFRTRIAMPQGTFAFSGVFTAVLARKGESYVFLAGHTSSVRANSARN